MTTPTRLERSLPSILGDLAAGPTPDYIDDVLTTTAQRRQRPGWTFPERWFPMAEVTSRSAFAPRLPWRTIAVALVIVALLVGAAIVYVGTQQTRLPAPFGPAANGLIPYSSNGDLYVGDLATGQSRLLVQSPELESGAVTSPDGTHIAFAREVPGTTTTDVWVVGTDGSDLHKITKAPLDMLIWGAFTPDGRQVALIHQVTGPAAGCSTTICRVARLDLVDASGGGASHTIATADGLDFVLFRPPDGRELLYRARVDGKWGLFAMDIAGGNVRPVVPATVPSEMDMTFASTSISADGNRIFFNMYGTDSSAGDPGCCQLYAVDADGTNLRKFLDNPGNAWDGEPVVSPDGKRVAFWHNLNDAPAHGVAVMNTDGTGRIIDTGPQLPGGGHWIWSPDSTRILMFPNDVDTGKAYLLDPAGGPWTTVPWTSDGFLDWQRIAPPS